MSENTWVVDSSREARTVDAINAELVDIEAGRLYAVNSTPFKKLHLNSLCTCTLAVVEESNIHAEQPSAQRPYRVACC